MLDVLQSHLAIPRCAARRWVGCLLGSVGAAACLAAAVAVASAGPPSAAGAGAGASPVAGVPRASLELLVGAPLNARGPLAIEQSGHPDLDFTARWRTRPFESPLYYGVRVAYGSSRRGWALDLLHHKLYLENNPPEVQSFTLTHGYNLVTVQRLWRWGPWQGMAGAGAVFPHVENTVRNQRYPENRGLFGAGYHLGGPAVVAGFGRRVRLGGPVQLALEARATLSRVWVDVVDGQASLTHAGLHALAGLSLGGGSPAR